MRDRRIDPPTSKSRVDNPPAFRLNCVQNIQGRLYISRLQIWYFKNADRYNVGVSRSRIRSHPWAIDWHHDFWPCMTLNCPSSHPPMSSKLQVKYSKKVDIGWPWTVLLQGHENCTPTDSIGQTHEFTWTLSCFEIISQLFQQLK